MSNNMINRSIEQIQLQSLLDSGLVPAWRQDFVRSICSTTRPTPKQMDWVTKILNELLIAPADVTSHSNQLDIQRIWAMFETAKKHLKYPKVHLDMNGKHIKLGIASSTAKRPGALSLVVNSIYIGCVDRKSQELILNRDGKVYSSQIAAFLLEFNKDPAKMATEYGKLHSSCCFCHLPLKTQESLAVGYGPDCASHYGLPWGKDKITDPEILEFTPVSQAAFKL